MAPGEDDFCDTTVEVTVTRDLAGQLRVASPHQACLVVIAGSRLGHRIQLGKGTVMIGRGSTSAVLLDSDSVSRQHARVEWTGSHHKLVDLNSTNGTYVNEAKIDDHVLADGDRVQVGKALLKYISGGNIESQYHEEIQRLTRYDGLTGVHNKRHFEETFETELMLSRTQPRTLTLVLFDLDHFKNVNDTWGHTAGDAILRQVAEIAAKQTDPDRQILGRVGGEEFALLWPGADLDQGRGLADRIREAVASEPLSFGGTQIPITVSLGVSVRGLESAEPGREFYQRADTKLYEAKAAGRNCVKV
jgi:diguanylate cyclase (GGDEF)-like protein